MQEFYRLQPLIWKFLTTRFSQKKLSGALLFLGNEAQFEIALDFVKYVLCDSNEKPCNRCPECIKVNSKTHPDLFIINSENRIIKIEMVRELIKKAQTKPIRRNYKIFIIQDAKNFNLESGNAFLKILEEPPLDCFFILITNSKENLLPTIVSRCFRIYFPCIKEELLGDFISKNYNFPQRKIEELARQAQGSLSKLKELLDENCKKEKVEIIKRVFFGKQREILDRQRLKKDLEFLINFLRDLLFYKLNIKENICNAELTEYLIRLSPCFRIENLLKILENFFKIKEAQDNINLKLASLMLTEFLKWQS